MVDQYGLKFGQFSAEPRERTVKPNYAFPHSGAHMHIT